MCYNLGFKASKHLVQAEVIASQRILNFFFAAIQTQNYTYILNYF